MNSGRSSYYHGTIESSIRQRFRVYESLVTMIEDTTEFIIYRDDIISAKFNFRELWHWHTSRVL